MYGVGMARVVTWARRGHPILFLRERTNCRSREIPSVEIARARELERSLPAQLAGHGLRLRSQGEESVSEREWCEEAVQELQLTIQRTRMNQCRAFQDWQALHQGFGRMTGATRERQDLGFEPDCDKSCVLQSSDEIDVQIGDYEASSPFLHQLDCSGSRLFDLHVPISTSGCRSR